MLKSLLISRKSTYLERVMAKTSSDKGHRSENKATESQTAGLSGKKNSVCGTKSSVLTWAHRTPRQLHASMYAGEP